MAIGARTNGGGVGVSDKAAALNKLVDESELGASAALVLEALDPILDRRLGVLLDKFEHTPPELGAMLDLRAQISEVWRISKEIRIFKAKGQTSFKALQLILDAERKVAAQERP